MKNLIFLFAILLGFVSCEKDVEPDPTPEPTPVSDTYHTITVSSEPSNDLMVDSIVYVNSETNFKQVATNITPTSDVCDGIDHRTHSFDLTTDYVKGDGCTITVYFAPSQGYKVFTILLLKDGQNVCEGASGNGNVITSYPDVYQVTKNL